MTTDGGGEVRGVNRVHVQFTSPFSQRDHRALLGCLPHRPLPRTAHGHAQGGKLWATTNPATAHGRPRPIPCGLVVYDGSKTSSAIRQLQPWLVTARFK